MTSQPGSQVEDATVTHPGVTVKGDVAKGGQVVQEPIGEGGQQVVMEKDVGGFCRESGGHGGGGE